MENKYLELCRNTALDAMEYGIAEYYQNIIDSNTRSDKKIIKNWYNTTNDLYSVQFLNKTEVGDVE